MTIGIYAIENIKTGDRYVGQSVNIEKRWARHKADLAVGRARSPALQEAWNYYGPDAFRFTILEECEAENLNKRENYHMLRGSSLNHETGYVTPLAIERELNIDPNSDLILDIEDLLDSENCSIQNEKELIAVLEEMARLGVKLEGMVESVGCYISDSGLDSDRLISLLHERVSDGVYSISGV